MYLLYLASRWCWWLLGRKHFICTWASNDGKAKTEIQLSTLVNHFHHPIRWRSSTLEIYHGSKLARFAMLFVNWGYKIMCQLTRNTIYWTGGWRNSESEIRQMGKALKSGGFLCDRTETHQNKSILSHFWLLYYDAPSSYTFCFLLVISNKSTEDHEHFKDCCWASFDVLMGKKNLHVVQVSLSVRCISWKFDFNSNSYLC